MSDDGVRLTDRERAVLRLLVERYGNAEIAESLGISKRTVESHVAALMRKYGVDGRRDLIDRVGPSTFRAALAEALRTVTDPAGVQAQAAELLGRHLAASRAYYQELDWDADRFTIHRDYCDGVPSIAGSYPLSAFADGPVAETLRSGRTLVVRDAQDLAPEAAAAWQAISVGAAMAAPNMRDGTSVAALGVCSAQPRDWTAEDVALLEETAERAWAFVERVRLENQLREAEDRFRVVADSMPALVWQTDHTGTPVFVNRLFRDHAGLTEVGADGDGVGARWHELVRQDGTDERARLLVRAHDGTWLPFETTATPRFAPDGTYLGELVIGHEVEGSG